MLSNIHKTLTTPVDPKSTIPPKNSSSSSFESKSAESKKLFISLEEFAKNHNVKGAGLHAILVGGGPRSAAQAISEIELLRTRKQDFDNLQKLGAKYDIRTTIIERQSGEYIARGNAWGPNQGYGTVNTPPEDGQNHKNRLQDFYKNERHALQADYDEKNPMAGSTLASAFTEPDGTEEKPNNTRAAITRSDRSSMPARPAAAPPG